MKRGKRKISVCQFLLSGIQTGNRADSGKMSMFKACTHTPLFPPTKRVHYSLWPQRSTVVGDLRAAYLPPRTHHLGKQSRMRRECPKCKPSLHCWLPGTSQCTTVWKFNLHLWTWFLVRGSDYYKPRCFFFLTGNKLKLAFLSCFNSRHSYQDQSGIMMQGDIISYL